MTFQAILRFAAPVTLETAETEFVPAVRELARKYAAIREQFLLPGYAIPDAEIWQDGRRIGHITATGRISRQYNRRMIEGAAQ
jgi:hypothetical protein